MGSQDSHENDTTEPLDKETVPLPTEQPFPASPSLPEFDKRLKVLEDEVSHLRSKVNLLEAVRGAKTRHLFAGLIGELKWNQAVASGQPGGQESFREQEFVRAGTDGSLAELPSEVQAVITEAYVCISNAQGLKRTFETMTNLYDRMSFGQAVEVSKPPALNAIRRALELLTEQL